MTLQIAPLQPATIGDGYDLLFSRARKGFQRRRYRGQIYDYARDIGELGPGYTGDWRLTNVCRPCAARGIANCHHFEIDTARHLLGPFHAILDPNVRVMMLLKAAQTAGSLVWDLAVHFILVHSPYMRVKVLMDSDEKARVYCVHRLMETLKRNPDIAPLLPTGAERFAVTDKELRLLNGKTLFVGGLNDRNASSLPADVMILDEGWLHQSDGLMKKAFDRLKQTKHGKIIIVGQAGNVDEDQDRIWKSLHARIPLTWACPCCGGRQQFELHKQRPDDFAAQTPNTKHQTPSNHQLATINFQLPLPPAPGSYVGFKIPKKFSELTTAEEIKSACAETVIECYHCGCELPDTPAVRRALNASFEQDYQLTAADGTKYTPLDYTVGFWNPDPASLFVPWRETMEAYVIAYKSNKELGNPVPIRDFYLSRWATPWSDGLIAPTTATLPINIFDEAAPMPGEIVRIAAFDVQDKLTNGWLQIWAIGEGSAMRLLHWEHVESPLGLTLPERQAHVKNQCRKRFKEFKVQPQNVKIDRAHEPALVLEWAAEDHVAKAELKHRDGRKSFEPVFYGLVLGDAAKGYKHKVRGNKFVWAGFSLKFYEQIVMERAAANGGPPRREALKVPYRLMSTERTQRLAQRFIDQQDAPKLEIPPHYLKDTGLLGLSAQLNSEHETLEKGKKVWKQIHQRPNHGRDCFRMTLMRMEECGLLVFAGRAEEEEESQ